MLSAKKSRIGSEPNRTSRTGYELNRISRTASEPSRRFLYTAAIEESTSTLPARITEALEGLPNGLFKVQESGRSPFRCRTELASKKDVDMENAKYDLEEHRLVCPRP
jgi:hypothetical protein